MRFGVRDATRFPFRITPRPGPPHSRDLPDEDKKWSREVPEGDATCADKHKACKDWAAAGECTKNAGFMLDACPYSCPDGCPHPIDPPGPKSTALVRDLWLQEDVGVFTARFTALKVEPHEARLVTLRWLEPADAAKLAASLDFGPRALANSVRAAATALKLGAAPRKDDGASGGGGGAAKEGGAAAGKDGGAEHFLRAKELETEVQRLHNQIKSRDREIAKMQKELDEVQCSKDHGAAAGDAAAATEAARRAALAAAGLEDGAGAGAGAGGASTQPAAAWLSWTESKVSLGLNVALAVLVGLLLAQQPRHAARRMGKTSRDLQ
ncbi:hypothetical protein GPECTOR_56g427 [Gonium pectorale]|uniref:ShKT domain-containing protein n=1 Tax=Gonium pectorale TaxID=33097 RepID=A0A150G7L2_GONPE|nr:hypothetical protein GPECTOR_56g427 [Gonium pectorale]|eukprot:KXZ45330.1 hypothetical protein GPECTOR_56g427 [Gonium pectorale]